MSLPARPVDLADFLAQEVLPPGYARQAETVWLPFLDDVRGAVEGGRLKVLGVHGAQGCGKSTLAALIKWYLEGHCGLRVAQLSLDDFYLTRDQRQDLAGSVHPLFATRGVPGTHDIPLALSVIANLKAVGGSDVALPRFDKALDDRAPPGSWPVVTGPIDLIVLEGWCVGATPQGASALSAPINQLEAEEDAEGVWREAVNAQLSGPYQQLFAELDYLLMLAAPDFDCVAGWRTQQEEKMIARRGAEGAGVMTPAQVLRFIQFYQRLTEHCLAELPDRADCVMRLGSDREVLSVQYRRGLQDD